MREDKKKVLEGVAASPGITEGKVKVLLKPEDGVKMKGDDILVASMTNPQYTPAILKASAIVTDVGGHLSHPAIVARELGIPCVVNTKEATEKLEDGMEVMVDGSKGVVYGGE